MGPKVQMKEQNLKENVLLCQQKRSLRKLTENVNEIKSLVNQGE